MSALIVTTPAPASSTPSRFTTEKPDSVNVTEYVPGRKSTIWYCPVPSVIAERVFSIRAGLAASTETPGNTAPDESFATPASETCATAAAGNSVTIPTRSHNFLNKDIAAPLRAIPFRSD